LLWCVCFVYRYLLHYTALPQRSTLFPYTTLFRSRCALRLRWRVEKPSASTPFAAGRAGSCRGRRWPRCVSCVPSPRPQSSRRTRSEEHTSELQSPDHLVCRPLLEKKTERKPCTHA